MLKNFSLVSRKFHKWPWMLVRVHTFPTHCPVALTLVPGYMLCCLRYGKEVSYGLDWIIEGITCHNEDIEKSQKSATKLIIKI